MPNSALIQSQPTQPAGDALQGVPSASELLMLTDTQAAQLLGIGKTLFRQMNSGALVPRPIRLGRRCLWSRPSIETYVKLGCPPREQFERLTGVRR